MDGSAIINRDTEFRWRMDAASENLRTPSIEAAIARLMQEHEWADIDSECKRRDIADGAWLCIADEFGVSEYQRGVMP